MTRFYNPANNLNRAQPQVMGIRVLPGAGVDRVDVEVEVAGGVYVNSTNGKKQESGAHDLRLFRDGQLVAQSPEPKDSTPDGISGAELTRWQNDTKVANDKDSRVSENGEKKIVHFTNIKLPHRGDGEVEFSAYAFNEDRVKGDTVKQAAKPAAGKVIKKAYLVAVGVNEYGQRELKLNYAVRDAQRMQEVLVPRLKQAGYQIEQAEVKVLISDGVKRQASKENIRKAIEEHLRGSTPDDLVIVFFSGHGYSGEHGAFYLMPSDSKPGLEADWKHPKAETLKRLISAQELTQWFRRVDAAEIVLIIDACHSAAATEGEGFKPGPMGSRGLGQLAYDKRMRVLAASQADQKAQEKKELEQGVLTYALLHDGLEKEKAVDQAGQITLKSWLEYPVKRVPELYAQGRAKDPLHEPSAQANQKAEQVPALFDFSRQNRVSVVLGQ